ncbi:hypothetical protein [Streptomyces sp. NRRL F-5123]|uniref:hypothetical protein n=1 Tax=Streptomyces sp. NRRL F-5123 TaxID=1463856 RepID=UPI0004E11AE5|nr:hypothetical protein [Streptomyces sp. NRRL F-5123]
MGSEETPAQKKQRAADLRTCASRARTLAGSLGGYLTTTVKQATADPPIWHGPYASQTTADLADRQKKLATMASDLLGEARRWVTEADRLDDEAAKSGAKAPAASGH